MIRTLIEDQARNAANTAAAAGLPSNPLSYLTNSDRDLIKAATGDAVDSQGNITGAPLPGESTLRPPDILLQIAGDRASGALTGDITPQYLQSLARRAAADGHPWPPPYLANGLKYLADEAGGAVAA